MTNSINLEKIRMEENLLDTEETHSDFVEAGDTAEDEELRKMDGEGTNSENPVELILHYYDKY